MRIRIWNPRQISVLASNLDAYKNATELRFDFSGTTDKGFTAVPPLPLVEIVDIFEEEALSDTSLQVLARFPKLRVLHLERTAITGRGFQFFATENGKNQDGRGLQRLSLAHNRLTDEGLREVARVASLRDLCISIEPGMTARAALEHLPKLDGLDFLVLGFHEKQQWTDGEKQQLLQRMPRCEVMFGVQPGESKRMRYKIGSGNPFAVPEP